MSDNETKEKPESRPDITQPDPEPRIALRLTPAIVLVVIQIGSTILGRRFGSTNIEIFLGATLVPALMLMLFGVWWLAFSRAPGRDRVIGFVVFLAALVVPSVFTIAPEFYIPLMGLYMLPGIVVVFLLTSSMTWQTRRRAATAVLLIVAGVFSLLRVQVIHGDTSLTLAWRWEPTIDQIAAPGQESPGDYASGIAELPSQLTSEDWPAFRGANRDGRNLLATFEMDWAANPPKELWRRPVGLGWSSFSAAGDYLFTQEQRGGDELVVCYNAATGEEVWANVIETRFNQQMGDGPRATPTYSDGKLYTQGATGTVQCIDAGSGETVWQANLQSDTGATVPTWGFSSSPLVTAGRVIVYAGTTQGKAVAAYDQQTGELVWAAGGGDHGYSSGQLTVLHGTPQVAMVSNFGLQSLEPETGEVLWEYAWQTAGLPRCIQPGIVGDGGFLLASFSPGGANGTRRIDVSHTDGAWIAKEKWTAKRFRPYFNDFVIHDGHLYGFDNSRLKSFDLETGEENWRGPRCGGQVLLLAAMDTLLILTEEGEVVLAEASPEDFIEISRIQAIDGKTWNHPVVSHGRLLVRNDHEAVCFAL